MPSNFNAAQKQHIRNLWAKPLLSYLRDRLQKKLFYLGLPAEEALDIRAWLEYIDKVYAFMCRDFRFPSDPLQDRKTVIALDNFLKELERKKLITTYEVFDGYLEEVILKGSDNSPVKKNFQLNNDFITLFNLDYCNNLNSPLSYIDNLGNQQTAYKFNAIRTLMSLQAGVATDLPKKFILFLTISCDYSEKNPQDFQQQLPAEYDNYLSIVNALSKKSDKAPYLLKAHAFHNLTIFFTANNFLPEFLPVIFYNGTGGNRMLFFTIIGTEIPNLPGAPQSLQSREDFLNRKFISIENSGNFVNNTRFVAHDEVDWEVTDPISIFESSQTFTQYWNV